MSDERMTLVGHPEGIGCERGNSHPWPCMGAEGPLPEGRQYVTGFIEEGPIPVCPDCGVAVYEMKKHDEWHTQQETDHA